jgi:hypothetical protein
MPCTLVNTATAPPARVARWYICISKVQKRSKFRYILEGLGMENAGMFYCHLAYFTVTWYIFLRSFGTFYGHLVHFIGNLVYFSILIWFPKNNLATLPPAIREIVFVCLVRSEEDRNFLGCFPQILFSADPELGCQIFLCPNTPKGEKYTKKPQIITNCCNLYQMAVKHSKWS